MDSVTGLGSITTILRTEPNWISPVEIEKELNQQVSGYPGTIQEILSWTQSLPYILSAKFTNLSKVEEYEMLEFFESRKGRLNPFWLPSQIKEFGLSQTMPNGSTNLYVFDNGFLDSYRCYERVYLDLISGDLITRHVTSVATGPGGNEITLHLDTILDREIAPSQVRKFGRLLFVRLAKDVMDLQYDEKSISSVQLSFQELVKEYPV